MAEGDIGERTGSVFLEEYDVGLAQTMGGELLDVEIDGEHTQEYAIKIDGVTGPPEYHGYVPIMMGESEPAYAEHLLPQIVIARGSIDPDMSRWHNQGFEYRVAAPNSTPVTVPGTGGQTVPSAVEIKPYAFPYNIAYDLHLRARHRIIADRMLKKIGRIFWAYAQIRFKDDTGCERGYYAFVESIQALNEVIDVTDRLQGHTFSLRVEAELDFREPIVQKTAQALNVNVNARRNVGTGAPFKGGPAALRVGEDC